VPGRKLTRPRGNDEHSVTKTSRSIETKAPTDKGPRSHAHKTDCPSPTQAPRCLAHTLARSRHSPRQNLAILAHPARGPSETGLANLPDLGPNPEIGARPKRSANSTQRGQNRTLENFDGPRLRGQRAEVFLKSNRAAKPHSSARASLTNGYLRNARRRYPAAAAREEPAQRLPLCRSPHPLA
jgi:hypothetical protein